MISFLRWSGRALFTALVIALLVGTGVILKLEGWEKSKLAALDAGSKVVTTAAGDIEYTERSAGPEVLICHGAPGGYDQAMLLGNALAKSGFRVIALSRPGFLRTLGPRESGTCNDLVLVTGFVDTSRPWVDPEVITDKLPPAKSLIVKGAGTLAWFGPDTSAAQTAIEDFLLTLPPVPTRPSAPEPSLNPTQI